MVVAAEIPVDALLTRMADRLRGAEVPGPEVDAELILGHVLAVSRGRVQSLAILRETVSATVATAALEMTEERAQRIPLQHLTGRAPFRGLELAVGPGVFTPRPETETVAQFAIDALGATVSDPPIAVDLCTGSGAIAIALAAEVPHARVWAVEKSRAAHAWAERNVAELGDGRVTLLRGDAADARALLADIDGAVDVLVSNPPYVPVDMVPRDPEVRDHDPALALYGGTDGLDVVRVIATVGLHLVRPGGRIVLEHAEEQGAAIRALLTGAGWSAAATHQDLTGRDRASTAVR